MICRECAQAAKAQLHLKRTGVPTDLPIKHPENCECTCQHRHAGSWKGDKPEEGLTGTKVPGIVLPS